SKSKAEKATLISEPGLYLYRQRPTLPHTFACSTIGPAGLNLRRFAGVSEAGARSRNPERSLRRISRAKGKSQIDLSTWLLLMPATTYSPTHFRVQHNRPCGA